MRTGLHGLCYKFSAGRHPRYAALNDIISLNGVYGLREFLLLWNRGELIGEMVRERMVLPCSHSSTREVCAEMPPVQTHMPILISIAQPYQ